jgi:uncharacterized protein with ACT and thioredoxin-like domain
MQVPNRCGVLESVAGVFARNHVSIASFLQKENVIQGDQAEIVLTTEAVVEKDFRISLSELSSMSDIIKEISSVIRVY